MKKNRSIHILCGWTGNRSDIHWVCRTQPPEWSLLIRDGARYVLLVQSMELHQMTRCVRRTVEVVAPPAQGSWLKACTDWMKKQWPDCTIQAAASCPAGLVEQLRDAGWTVQISRAPACPRRDVKTAEEIAHIRTVQRAAVEAMKGAIQQISAARPGRQGLLRHGRNPLTSEQVQATICHTLLDRQCTADEVIVSCGPASADPHERGHGPLYAGQPIVIDIFPRSQASGYWGDLTRTVCRGSAPPALRRQFAAVKAAHAAALNEIAPGVWTHHVHQTAEEVFTKRGYQTKRVDGFPQGFIHSLGHGIGLDVHETPRLSATVRRRLREGHVVTVEPGLYYPEIGGVRIEDTVEVTANGFRKAAGCPIQLEI